MANERILVVDDHEHLRQAAALLLRREGYEVAEAATGAEGLRLAQAWAPDVVLLDVVLPDADGMALCPDIKAATGGQTTVLLLSGKKIASADQSQGLEGGADDYIVRPVPNREMLARVHAWMRIRQAHAETRQRVAQQAAVARLGQRALSGASLPQLMDEATAAVVEALHVDMAKVLALQPGGEALRLVAGVGWREGLVGAAMVSADASSQAGYTLVSDQAVIVEDLTAEERFTAPPLLLEHHVRSGISVAIRGREAPYGVLGAHVRTPRLFSAEDVHFVEAVANVLAAAVGRQAARETIERQLTFERALASISSRFVGPVDLDEAIDRSLAELGVLCDAGRAYLFRLRDQGRLLDNTHEWCAPGVAPQIETLQGIATADMAWWMAQLQSGDSIVIADVTDMPAEAAAEQQSLQAQGIRSCLVLPLQVGHSLGGFVGLDNVLATGTWSAEEVAVLRAAAEIMGSAIHRAELAAQSERYAAEVRALVDHTPDMIVRFGPDLGLTYANPAVEQELGVDRQALVGRSLRALGLRQEAIDIWEAALQAAFDTGQERIVEIELDTPRGRHWYRCRMAPERGPDGQVATVLAVLGDITALRRANEALLDEQELLNTLMDNVPDFIFIKDREGRYLRNNRAHLDFLGLDSQSEAMGRTDLDLLVAFQAGQFMAAEAELLRTGVPQIAQERRVTGGDGRDYWVSATKVPLRDESGQIVGLLGIIRDLTEHKRLEDQLLRAQKMEAVGQLAGGVAHDFNNWLTAIQGYAGLSMMQVDEDEPLYRDLMQINEASVRAAEIVRQLLLFSRKQPMRMEPLLLNDVVERLLKMLKRLIGEDVRVEAALGDDIWPVVGDATNLEQVLVNLALNARDAMPNGGKLIIETANVTIDPAYCQQVTEARPGRFVRLTVRDSGTGMTHEVMEHLFEPFYTTKEPGKGTGLGLAVIYGIVKQHEGWITVETEVGHGSAFQVLLPAAVEAEPGEGPQPPVVPATRGQGQHVLLVEDEPAVRRFITRALTAHGYRLTVAASAEEALQVFKEKDGDFDLLFSDIVLAGQSGLSLAEQLVALNPALPVLLSSGYHDERARWNVAMERGFRFLAKPYALADMLALIEETIREAG